MASIKQTKKRMDSILEKMMDLNKNAPILSLSVSQAPIGWHIAHAMLVIEKVIQTVIASDPTTFKATKSLKKIICFFTGRFPRGKGKAPESVIPNSAINFELQYQNTQIALQHLYNAQEDQYFTHPIFGQLNKNETLKFLEIHSKHHLFIINDILKANKSVTINK